MTRRARAGETGTTVLHGRVVACFGRHYLVETDAGRFLESVTRGKQAGIACGDRALVAPTSDRQGVIESLAPRRSLFLRAAAHRRKLIAANATQLAIVVAGEPSFSDELVYRAIVAAEHAGMKAFVCLNKTDLAAPTAAARERLAPLSAAGYDIIELAAKREVGALVPRLQGELTVLVGQSGMGKSTIVNALVPAANVATREISRFLDSGRHTTTHARLYPLDGDSAIIDCPGLQDFGLAHLAADEIEAGFVEVRPHIGRCRFPDCRHRTEPACAVRRALVAGQIHPRRLELLHRILAAEAAART